MIYLPKPAHPDWEWCENLHRRWERMSPALIFAYFLVALGFVINSIDVTMVPWSREGQSGYPYRFSSVVCLKYLSLLALYTIFIVGRHIYYFVYPSRRPSHQMNYRHRVERELAEVFDDRIYSGNNMTPLSSHQQIGGLGRATDTEDEYEDDTLINEFTMALNGNAGLPPSSVLKMGTPKRRNSLASNDSMDSSANSLTGNGNSSSNNSSMPNNPMFTTIKTQYSMESSSMGGATNAGNGPDLTGTEQLGTARGTHSWYRSGEANQHRSISEVFAQGRIFAINGICALFMDVCLFIVMKKAAPSSFGIARNLVVPFTVLIRALFFNVRPSPIQWLAFLAIALCATSFAAQTISHDKKHGGGHTYIDHKSSHDHSDHSHSLSSESFILAFAFMTVYIVTFSFNTVWMEKKFKRTFSMSFAEQQWWIIFYSSLFTLIFWMWDDRMTWFTGANDGNIFRGYSYKTIAFIIWRVFYQIIFYFIVKYLTSVVAILIFTVSSLGTAVLEWMIWGSALTLGQWSSGMTLVILVAIYKVSPFQKRTKKDRKFEILEMDDDYDDEMSDASL